MRITSHKNLPVIHDSLICALCIRRSILRSVEILQQEEEEDCRINKWQIQGLRGRPCMDRAQRSSLYHDMFHYLVAASILSPYSFLAIDMLCPHLHILIVAASPSE